MFVLFGTTDKTVENETVVYFIGVFETGLLALEERNGLMEKHGTKKNDYIIKQISVNTRYDYAWSNNEVDEI